jgi:hypothetical protein
LFFSFVQLCGQGCCVLCICDFKCVHTKETGVLYTRKVLCAGNKAVVPSTPIFLPSQLLRSSNLMTLLVFHA